ncbi:hypothetical protein D9M68_777810 [compost metagenome]
MHLLPGGRTERVGRFQQVLVDQADAQVGEADHRWNGVDHHRNQPRHAADAQQHHHRDQVDEARHGLHHVQRRVDHLLQAVPAAHGDTQRQADHQRDHGADEDHRDGLHRVAPHAEEADQQQRDHGTDHDLERARGQPGHQRDTAHHQRPGRAREQVFGGQQKFAQGIEQALHHLAMLACETTKGAIHRAPDFTERVGPQRGKFFQPGHVLLLGLVGKTPGKPRAPRAHERSLHPRGAQ